MNELEINDLTYLDSVDSTNLYCLREINSVDSGAVIVADQQTAGRGRLGRSWYSPEEVNLYTSIVLKKPPSRIAFSLLPMISCLAIYQSIKHFGVRHCWIKWPNDVYVENLKIAGVLIECTTLNNRSRAAVIGMGVNLNMSNKMSLNIDKQATSIFMETNKLISRDAFLQFLIKQFNSICLQAQISGRDSIYKSWKDASRLINRTVSLTEDFRQTISGRVLDLNPDGSILIETRSGEKKRFISGNLSLQIQLPNPGSRKTR